MGWFTDLWKSITSPSFWDAYKAGKEQYGSSALSVGYQNYQDQKSNSNGIHSIWDDITGRTNTDVANSATAALQEDAQEFNAEEAQKQRDFESQQADIERERADTAIQRQVADYQAAGLNPWLAAGSGGAGSPGIPSGYAASSGANSAINATKSGTEVLSAATNAAVSAAIVWKILKKLA